MRTNLIQINFNFFRTPEGPKRKLPVKTVLSTIIGFLTLLSGGTQRQLTQGMTMEIVSATPNSVFTVGSTVPLVAEATTTRGTIKSVEFRANGRTLGRAEARLSK